MGEGIEEIKKDLFEIFPNLLYDDQFEITSKASPDYNCIAWACNYNERWIQPLYLEKPNLDCVVWWPPNASEGTDIVYLKLVFEDHGYFECESGEHEEGYRKVALYYFEETNEWTHAARELANGCWTSKLGHSSDIQHSTPETIESDVYGKVFCYMKRKYE